MAAARLMLIRHAEKAGALEPAANLDEDGAADAQGLSVQGWQRAGALVRFFAPLDPHGDASGLARPTAIFAMDTTAQYPSRRPALTVGPLAQLLNLPVQCMRNDAELRAGIHMHSGPVLVCWRHGELPGLARSLAPTAAVPADWPPRHDLVWVIEPADDTPCLRQVPQLLLPGDSRLPITNPTA